MNTELTADVMPRFLATAKELREKIVHSFAKGVVVSWADTIGVPTTRDGGKVRDKADIVDQILSLVPEDAAAAEELVKGWQSALGFEWAKGVEPFTMKRARSRSRDSDSVQEVEADDTVDPGRGKSASIDGAAVEDLRQAVVMEEERLQREQASLQALQKEVEKGEARQLAQRVKELQDQRKAVEAQKELLGEPL